MAVEKFSVSLDPELSRALRQAAEEDDVSVSAWMAEAVRQRLRNHLLRIALDEIMAEEGWTHEDLAEIARRDDEALERAAALEQEDERRSA